MIHKEFDAWNIFLGLLLFFSVMLDEFHSLTLPFYLYTVFREKLMEESLITQDENKEQVKKPH